MFSFLSSSSSRLSSPSPHPPALCPLERMVVYINTSSVKSKAEQKNNHNSGVHKTPGPTVPYISKSCDYVSSYQTV